MKCLTVIFDFYAAFFGLACRNKQNSVLLKTIPTELLYQCPNLIFDTCSLLCLRGFPLVAPVSSHSSNHAG